VDGTGVSGAKSGTIITGTQYTAGGVEHSVQTRRSKIDWGSLRTGTEEDLDTAGKKSPNKKKFSERDDDWWNSADFDFDMFDTEENAPHPRELELQQQQQQ